MKKLNKKGFTLIELLAVIVILALLVAVAVPAVTKYLNTSRKGVMADNAAVAISAVRNDVIINGFDNEKTYDIDHINNLLEKKLNKSPFGNVYTDIKVKVENVSDVFKYSIFITDGSNCIGTKVEYIYENDVKDDAVTIGDKNKCVKTSES